MILAAPHIEPSRRTVSTARGPQPVGDRNDTRASRLVLVMVSLCCVLLISVGAALVRSKSVSAATSLMVIGELYAGQDITVRGSGFQAGENVLVSLDGVQIGSTTARQEMSIRNSTAG